MANTAPNTPVKKKKRKKKRVSKQQRLLLVAGIVIAALLLVVGLLFLLQSAAPEKSEASNSMSMPDFSNVKTLINYSTLDLASLEITNHDDPDASLLFVRRGEQAFDLPALKGYSILQSKINSAVSGVARVYIQKQIEDGAQHLAEYGLDTPVLTVTYVTTEGETSVLEVGDPVPGIAECYARLQGAEEVYTILVDEVWTTPVTTYVDPLVLEKPEHLYNVEAGMWVYPEKWESAEMSGTHLGENTMFITPADESQMTDIMAAAYSYQMVYGEQSALLNNTFVTEIQDGNIFFGLTAESVAAVAVDNAKIAEFGLDNPYQRLSITADGITYTLKCSEPTSDGYYYVLREGYKVIYKVPVDTLTWANQTYATIASALVYTPYIVDVDHITLDFGDGMLHDLAITHAEVADDTVIIYNDDIQLIPSDYRSFFSLIIYCTKDELIPEGANLDVDPKLTITYTESDGSEHTVRFLPVSARSVAIEYDGYAQYTMRAEFIDKIARELQHLIDGEKVDTTW